MLGRALEIKQPVLAPGHIRSTSPARHDPHFVAIEKRPAVHTKRSCLIVDNTHQALVIDIALDNGGDHSDRLSGIVEFFLCSDDTIERARLHLLLEPNPRRVHLAKLPVGHSRQCREGP